MSTTGLVLWALCMHVYSRTTTLWAGENLKPPRVGGFDLEPCALPDPDGPCQRLEHLRCPEPLTDPPRPDGVLVDPLPLRAAPRGDAEKEAPAGGAPRHAQAG